MANTNSNSVTATDRPCADPGDDAFGQFLVGMQRRLHAFLRQLQPGETDDLVQETIVRAWRSRATFDPGRGSGAPWLLRIAFTVFVDQRDASKPARSLEAAPIASEPGPPQHAADRERTASLLALLSDRERDVLLRFHRDGQPVATIARALALPEGTIKSHLHRARARLWANENTGEAS